MKIQKSIRTKYRIIPSIRRKPAGYSPEEPFKLKLREYKRIKRKIDFPNGRPAIYDAERFPKIAYSACAEMGATNEDLARLFGVTVMAIEKWIREHSEFARSVYTGKDEFDSNKVEKSLRLRALGYDKEYEEVSETIGGKYGHSRTVNKKLVHVPPDVKAAIFWLKNRNRNRWQDVSVFNQNLNAKVDHSGTIRQEISGEINRNDTQTINKNYNLNITTNAEDSAKVFEILLQSGALNTNELDKEDNNEEALETELQQIQLDSLPTT